MKSYNKEEKKNQMVKSPNVHWMAVIPIIWGENISISPTKWRKKTYKVQFDISHNSNKIYNA